MACLSPDFFDFNFPSQSVEGPSTPPDMSFVFDPSLLNIPYSASHHRSSSKGSVYSTVSSTPDSVCTRVTTPPRDSTPVCHHGPLLLPKIRPQDQDLDAVSRHDGGYALPNHVEATTTFRPSHARSYTDPNALNSMALVKPTFSGQAIEDSLSNAAPLLCSPASFAHRGSMSRRASSCSIDASAMEKWGFPSYHMSSLGPTTTTEPDFSSTASTSTSYAPQERLPIGIAATSDPMTPSTTLLAFLTGPNPAASLVRSIPFVMRDPSTKHFWWDVRSVRSWASFNISTVMSLPGASGLLIAPVPAPMLPSPRLSARHPETEEALHSIYASYYLPKLNAALAMSSSCPMQLSVPTRTGGIKDHLFVAIAAGESTTAAAMFGGKPSARVVGLVRSFERFNTGMRVESNIKRVEYLRGLAAVHHAMREHGCRFGFILTEIELVVLRNGTEATPYFGDLEVASVRLATCAPEAATPPSKPAVATTTTTTTTTSSSSFGSVAALPSLTACLALWGLCRLAGDNPPSGQPAWKSDIGAPAEGTRRKAKPRDSWMPQPQLAEKRAAKRGRGWVWPEDPVGRKELGRRGVRYGGL